MGAFAAIGAHGNVRAACEERASEARVALVVPNVSHAVFFQRPHDVMGILVKTARHHTAVPCDDRALPHSPAGVLELIAQGPFAGEGIAVVPSVLWRFGQQRMAVPRVVQLGGLDFHLIHAAVLGRAKQFRHFVLIGADHQKLPHQVRAAAARFFGVDHGLGSFHDFLKRSADAVGGIRVLGQPVDGDDQAAQTGVDQLVASHLAEVMGVCGGGTVNVVIGAAGNQRVKLRMQQWFSLEVQVYVGQPGGKVLQPFHGIPHIQHACRSCEGTQSAWALRASQVARRGRFDGEGGGHGRGWHHRLPASLGPPMANGKPHKVGETSGRKASRSAPPVLDFAPSSHARKVRSGYLRQDDQDWRCPVE